MEKKKIAVLKDSLQATAASLLVLLQLYGTLIINIFQEQRKLNYLMAKLITSPNMAVEKIRRTTYRYLYLVCLLLYPEVKGIFLETRQSSSWPSPLKTVSK